MGCVEGLLLGFVVFQPRCESFRLLAIGSAVEFHLQNAQVDAKLNLVAAIVSAHNPNSRVCGIVLPAGQNMGNVL